MMKLLVIALMVLLCAVLAPSEAKAYIDPGSGSAIMSAIIGFVVAIGLFLKTFWYKIASLFSRKSSSKEDS